MRQEFNNESRAHNRCCNQSVESFKHTISSEGRIDRNENIFLANVNIESMHKKTSDEQEDTFNDHISLVLVDPEIN